MELSEARSLLGQHWSSFVGAVFDPTVRATPGGVQMYVWQSLSNFYLSRGEALPPNSFAAVNRLLSVAGQQYRANASLGAALLSLERTGLDLTLSADHIAPSINAGRPQDQPLGPQYRATYASLWLVDGEPMLQYRTHDFGYDLPQSVSALKDIIDAAAPVDASDYEAEFGGAATPISIQSY